MRRNGSFCNCPCKHERMQLKFGKICRLPEGNGWLIFRDYQNIVSLIYYKRLNTTVLKSETISEIFILFLQTKRYNVSVILNVNVALIYVATWRNEKKVNKKSNVSAISYYIE